MDTRFLGHRPLLSGRRVTAGPLLPITAPIDNDYDPALFEGAMAYGNDRQFYYSDGAEWVVPSEDVIIARPSALVPTTAFEQMQLRLTEFYSPAGLSQVGALFQIAASENGFDAPLFTKTINGEVSSYTTLYPEDGLVPGQEFWWRALYYGTEGQQSDFSTPFKQVYPDFITNPTPVTREGITSGTVDITPFESAFGFLHVETQVEFFLPGDTTTPVASVADLTGASVTIPSGLAEGQEYLWRARYGGRANQAGSVTYTDWTELSSVFNGAASIVLVYDPNLALNRTIHLPLGLESSTATVNVTVAWGDGTSESFTSRGTRSHQYASGVTDPVTVTISGDLTHYGGDVDQTGLLRVDSFGFKLGLISLRRALMRTSPNLSVVNAKIPPQVTDLSGLFEEANIGVDLSGLDLANVTNISRMFHIAEFNGDLSGWDTSRITNMEGLFYRSSFNNSSIANWDVSSVTNMAMMFAGHPGLIDSPANPDITGWNTSSVETMERMFWANTAFNRPIGAWDTSACSNFRQIFARASAFNQDLTDWDVSGATDLYRAFYATTAFEGDLSGWDVSNVTSMREMFARSDSYGGDLSQWNVARVETMREMFRATDYTGDLRAWDVRNVRDMNSMFRDSGGLSLVQLSTWQPRSCEDFGSMFYRCFGFNDDISNWDVSAGRDFAFMLFRAEAFARDIDAWDISSAANMVSMLEEAASFDRSLAAWSLNPDGIDLRDFGHRTNSWSTQNYSRTLVGWANSIRTTGGPVDTVFQATGTSGAPKTYDAVDYEPGAAFANAPAARSFLTAPPAVEVAGATDLAANQFYSFQPASLTYAAPNGWRFVRSGNAWVLENNLAAPQATGPGNTGTPVRATSWDGVLAGATLTLAGAGWTITGDAPL